MGHIAGSVWSIVEGVDRMEKDSVVSTPVVPSNDGSWEPCGPDLPVFQPDSPLSLHITWVFFLRSYFSGLSWPPHTLGLRRLES